jgi:hypothetical protein
VILNKSGKNGSHRTYKTAKIFLYCSNSYHCCEVVNTFHLFCYRKFMTRCYHFCLTMLFTFIRPYGLKQLKETRTRRGSTSAPFLESRVLHVSLMNHFRRAQNELSTTSSAFQMYFKSISAVHSAVVAESVWVPWVQIRIVSKYCNLDSEFYRAGLMWCAYPNILSICWLLRSSGMN